MMICSLVWGQTIKIPVDAVSLEYNDYFRKAYAGVGSYDQHYPNTLIQMNPYNGTVERQLRLNSEPGILKTTPDKKYMYLSFQSVPGILKINLTTFMADDTIDTGGAVVVDFDVVPTSQNDLVVVRDDDPNPSVCLYKNGFLMPEQIRAGYDTPSKICIKSDGTKIFGTSSSGDGWIMNIVSTGIQYDSIKWDDILSTSGEIKLHNDLIYTRLGQLLDAFSDSIPKLVANMPIYNFLFVYCAGVEYSPIHGCFLFGHKTNNSAYISFFDGQSFNYCGSLDVDNNCDAVHDVTVVDNDDFILRSYDDENQMCLLFHHAATKDRIFLDGRNDRKKWENDGVIKSRDSSSKKHL